MVKVRALIVEDNLLVRTSVYHYLLASGVEPVMCDGGRDGLDHASRQDFDVAIIDVTLPDLTGWEVAKQLRQQAFRGPIVMWSGSNQDEERVKASGADWFLLKPFDTGSLIDLIWHLVDKVK